MNLARAWCGDMRELSQGVERWRRGEWPCKPWKGFGLCPRGSREAFSVFGGVWVRVCVCVCVCLGSPEKQPMGSVYTEKKKKKKKREREREFSLWLSRLQT